MSDFNERNGFLAEKLFAPGVPFHKILKTFTFFAVTKYNRACRFLIKNGIASL